MRNTELKFVRLLCLASLPVVFPAKLSFLCLVGCTRTTAWSDITLTLSSTRHTGFSTFFPISSKIHLPTSVIKYSITLDKSKFQSSINIHYLITAGLLLFFRGEILQVCVTGTLWMGSIHAAPLACIWVSNQARILMNHCIMCDSGLHNGNRFFWREGNWNFVE